jgi:adenine phosphoribosyltransferase
MQSSADLLASIRTVPDFPKKGIMFRDITTLLKNPAAFAAAIDRTYEHYRDIRVDKVVGIESRGFILGAPLAYRVGAGFVPARKAGKLPAAVTRETYSLEYGTDSVEIHNDAIAPGDRILLHDDLLATGGTMRATARLVERLGGTIVGYSFLIELAFLKGRAALGHGEVFSLLTYDSE